MISTSTSRNPAWAFMCAPERLSPDFADPKDWVFDGTAAQDLLPPSVVEGVEADGHAFRDMD
ncbi:hypothetical protein [Rhizobium rhizogenes]|uniref:hypothetical protein n=1 Tax=Rhizobium rhizogenes TaxID=359 RepID=UPI001E486584|nr:hypothetical protein [Rhizobium rhizogenes]